MVLFAIIDIPGSIPIIIDIKSKSGDVKSAESDPCILPDISVHFYLSEAPLLGVFGIDVSSFAIAGSFIIFLIAMEMILGIELFKQDAHGSGCSIPDSISL